ncbi:acid protease [Sparassis latifolia]
MSNVLIRTLPFSSRFTIGSGKELVARDYDRAQKLLQGLHPHGPAAAHEARRRRDHHHHHKHQEGTVHEAPGSSGGGSGAGSTTGSTTNSGSGVGVDVTDASVNYNASVGVGSPATTYTLLIDTGSSNTWVGAGQKYVQTSTSQSTGNSVSVSYGSGSFSGTEYVDTVTISPSLVIAQQSIGVASTAQGFSGVDGILGIGPVDLTSGTVSNTDTVPTVTDNLFAQGTITEDSIGISFEPTTSDGQSDGELTFGGSDSTRYTGTITYTPITTTSPASNYWGINQDVTYGQGGTTLLSGAPGIVDTGTTLLMLASDAFNAYQQATGATMDNTTGLLTITQEQYANLQSLFFTVGGTTFELTANAQIWPRSLNTTLGGNADQIYLVASSTGTASGSGLDFINGFAFLQRFYSVFDTGNSQVGLATTPYTDATTN